MFGLVTVILMYIHSVICVSGWFRHCAASRKLAGSIPNGIIGIFRCPNLSGRTMVVGWTQFLTEMSTKNISWGGGGGGVRCVGLTTLPPSCAEYLEILGVSAPWSAKDLACTGVVSPNAKRWDSRVRLKSDGTRAETRFRLSAKRKSPFKSVGAQFSRLLAAEVCASAVVMLDTPCSEVV